MAQDNQCEYLDPDTSEACGSLDAELVMMGWTDEGPGNPAATGSMAGELTGKHLCAAHRAKGEAQGWVPKIDT